MLITLLYSIFVEYLRDFSQHFIASLTIFSEAVSQKVFLRTHICFIYNYFRNEKKSRKMDIFCCCGDAFHFFIFVNSVSKQLINSWGVESIFIEAEK